MHSNGVESERRAPCGRLPLLPPHYRYHLPRGVPAAKEPHLLQGQSWQRHAHTPQPASAAACPNEFCQQSRKGPLPPCHHHAGTPCGAVLSEARPELAQCFELGTDGQRTLV